MINLPDLCILAFPGWPERLLGRPRLEDRDDGQWLVGWDADRAGFDMHLGDIVQSGPTIRLWSTGLGPGTLRTATSADLRAWGASSREDALARLKPA